MNDPYPSDDELKKIADWPYTDAKGLLEHIESYWSDHCGSWKKRGRTYWLSTGGWSGNEDIMGEMQRNVMFWSLCWVSSRRGGHYVFRLPKL